MEDQIRILSVGAHPADVFDQSGGTMAHHASRGDYVACVVITHGARVHDAVISEDMSHRDEIPDGDELLSMIAERSDIKAEEVRTAGRILGFEDIYFLGADDAVLLVTEIVVKQLAKIIREVRPDIILTHYPKESGGITSPHAIGGQIALFAMQHAASVDPGDRNPPHSVAQVFFFGCGAASTRSGLWGAEGGFTNDVFVDITDVADKKLAALDTLVSQGYDGAYAKKRIEASDGAFGVAASTAYAEGFISLMSAVHYYLPLSDYALKNAKSSDHEKMAKYSYRLPVD